MSKLDYVISYETMMIETADHPEYSTKIIDKNKGIIYSKRPAKTLIKESALYHNQSIKGHIEVVKSKYPSMKKIPLMINSTLSIIMIPTSSQSNNTCKWLNFIQINKYLKEKKQTKIQFRNGEETILPISYYIFDKQMSKATKIISMYLSQKVEYKLKSEEERLKMIKELLEEYIEEEKNRERKFKT
ncbi:competence protein ComK [Gottfriedia luciferensis]|uniref:competence protein ComK n=1 Tax=Gottfriedia luciferensis TaxID=178774 RepID=UPI0013021CA0|nr:competence protein ComK [Gottfriedia luciferensis]